MDTISDAKKQFSAVLDTVQTQPVMISKHGRPVAVVRSVAEFDRRLSFRRDAKEESNQPIGLGRRLGRSLDRSEPSRTA